MATLGRAHRVSAPRPGRAHRLSALVIVARLGLGMLGFAACSPYDPSLPSMPFLCGDQEPRCPDGYVCVGEPDGRRVCRADGTVPDAGVPDAAPTAKRSEAATRQPSEARLPVALDALGRNERGGP